MFRPCNGPRGLILVYPTWWYSQPAILKGWIDRVWRPGIAFTLHEEGQRLRPALANIRLIGVITSFGSPWWFWTFLIGAPGRKIVLRGLRFCTNRRTKTFWLGLYAIDEQTDVSRRRYIDKVRARIAQIPIWDVAMGHIGHWADLTAPEFAALDREGAVAILPIGAIEQHGPHLAMSVDRDLTLAVLTRALPLIDTSLSVLALPVQAIGKSTEHQAWPGTLSLSVDTLLRVLHDIAASVHRAGVPRLMILNGLGGNWALLDLACRDLRAELGLVTAHVAWDDLAEAETVVGAAEAQNGLHAGEVETSGMLAAHLDKVRFSQTEDFGSAHLCWQRAHPGLGLGSAPLRPGWLMADLSPKGTIGNATAATAEKGETLLTNAARNLARLVSDFSHFAPGRSPME
jgi:creatinine amidohydrolase